MLSFKPGLFDFLVNQSNGRRGYLFYEERLQKSLDNSDLFFKITPRKAEYRQVFCYDG